MGKVTFNVGNLSDVDAAESKFYNGEVPPRGQYRTKVALCKLRETRNGDPMLTFVFEINEPKGSDKARFNGYGIWHNAVLVKKSAPFVNGMLDGLGIDRRNLWVGGVVTDPKDDEVVLRIGKVKIDGKETTVSTKRRIYNDEPQLSIVNFFPVGDSDDSGDDLDLGEGASMDDEEEETPSLKKAPAKRKPKAKPEPEPEPEDEDEDEGSEFDDEWDTADDDESF